MKYIKLAMSSASISMKLAAHSSELASALTWSSFYLGVVGKPLYLLKTCYVRGENWVHLQ